MTRLRSQIDGSGPVSQFGIEATLRSKITIVVINKNDDTRSETKIGSGCGSSEMSDGSTEIDDLIGPLRKATDLILKLKDPIPHL